MNKCFDLEKLTKLYNSQYSSKVKLDLEEDLKHVTDSENVQPTDKLKKKIKFSINDMKECIEYINDHIFSMKGGQYAVFLDNKIHLLDHTLFRMQYLNRFPEPLKHWFLHTPDVKYYTLDCDPQQKIGVDKVNKIVNSPPEMKAIYKKYSLFSEECKKKMNFFLAHVKNILCYGDINQYNYLLKIIKNMCLGIKNNICVVLSGPSHGTGKSALVKFLQDHIFGSDSTGIGSCTHLEKFNAGLFQKILVYFEEADRMFTTSTRSKYIGSIKTWTTESTITYEEKGEKMFDAKNHHTIFLTSNDVGFLGYEETGRRFFILDINPEKKGKLDYFKQLYACFTDEVGSCLYSYLIDEITIEDNFVADLYMPLTENKKDAFAERLSLPLKFLKFAYVLKGLGINERLKDVFTNFQNEKPSHLTVTKFNKLLKENFPNHISSSSNKIPMLNGFPKFVISRKELHEIYTKNNWIYEGVDEFDGDVLTEEYNKEIVVDEESMNVKFEIMKCENDKLRAKILELENMLQDKKENTVKTVKTEIELLDDELENMFIQIPSKGKTLIKTTVTKKKQTPAKLVKSSVVVDSETDDIELNDDDITNLANLF